MGLLRFLVHKSVSRPVVISRISEDFMEENAFHSLNVPWPVHGPSGRAGVPTFLPGLVGLWGFPGSKLMHFPQQLSLYTCFLMQNDTPA